MRSRSLRELGVAAARTLMELLPLWMVCVVVRASLQEPPGWSFGSCWLLLLSAAVLVWHSSRWRLPPLATIPLLLAAACILAASWFRLVLPLSAAAAMWSALLGAYLTARGLLIGRAISQERTREVLRWFGIGLGVSVLLFAFIALSGVPSSALPMQELRGLCLGHVVLGAVASGLDQRRGQLAGSQLMAAPSIAASMAIGLPVIAIVGLSLVVSFGMDGIRWAVGFAMLALRAVAEQGLVALHALAAFFIATLHWLGSLWGPTQGSYIAPPAANSGTDRPFVQLVYPKDRVLHVGTEDVLLLIVGLVCAGVFAYTIAWLRGGRTAEYRAPEPNAREEHESTWSWALLLEPFQQLGGLRRARRKSSEVSSDPNTLRALYRMLLAWAHARGIERRPSATAHELVPQLADAVPHKAQAFATFADDYAKERYAERACSDEELEHARRLVEEVTACDA